MLNSASSVDDKDRCPNMTSILPELRALPISFRLRGSILKLSELPKIAVEKARQMSASKPS